MTLGWPCAARHQRRLDDRDHGAGRPRRRPAAVAGRPPRGPGPRPPAGRAAARARRLPGHARARRDGRGRGRAARARRAPGRRGRQLRAGRAVVRARPLRPAPADPDPRGAARLPHPRRADLHRHVPRAGRTSTASASSSRASWRACGPYAPRSRPSTSTSRATRGPRCAAATRARSPAPPPPPTSACPTSPRRSSACWRSCPARATASAAPSASCSRPWPPARATASPRS